jgi:hypothetical protein
VSIQRYKCWNAPMATSAAMAPVATGTSVKTMLQIAVPSTRQFTVISWGYTVDQLPTTTSNGKIELIETDVAATVTAHVASGVQPLLPNAPASLATLGASATGYTASAEGTIAATRTFDEDIMLGAGWAGASPSMYDYQFMPDERPVVNSSKFLRVRATFGVAVDLACWVVWEE